MLKIYGVPFSAHTRKVILAANEKKIGFELVPTVPLDPPENWRDLSPTGKIPVLVDGDFTVADSSVICAYLERKKPTPALYPSDPRECARALWLEEYVDGYLEQHVLKGFLLETVFAPAFLNREPDWEVVERNLKIDIPERFAYLESQIEGDGFLVGNRWSIADITLTSILINFSYGGQTVDAGRFPKLSAYFRGALRYSTVRDALQREREAVAQIPGMDSGFHEEVA